MLSIIAGIWYIWGSCVTCLDLFFVLRGWLGRKHPCCRCQPGSFCQRLNIYQLIQLHLLFQFMFVFGFVGKFSPEKRLLFKEEHGRTPSTTRSGRSTRLGSYLVLVDSIWKVERSVQKKVFPVIVTFPSIFTSLGALIPPFATITGNGAGQCEPEPHIGIKKSESDTGLYWYLSWWIIILHWCHPMLPPNLHFWDRLKFLEMNFHPDIWVSGLVYRYICILYIDNVMVSLCDFVLTKITSEALRPSTRVEVGGGSVPSIEVPREKS